jgi:hypothetical protein
MFQEATFNVSAKIGALINVDMMASKLINFVIR